MARGRAETESRSGLGSGNGNGSERPCNAGYRLSHAIYLAGGFGPQAMIRKKWRTTTVVGECQSRAHKTYLFLHS
jgi:hypothetical protein